MDSEFYDQSYYESGPQSGKSLYQAYGWRPELTIPLAHHIVTYLGIEKKMTIQDFGCAKGYLVHALRLLGYQAWGVDVSSYAISNAPKEAAPFISLIAPGSGDFNTTDYLVAKDVLEHIPHDQINAQLKVIERRCSTMFAIVPLGDGNGKYVIPAYELDKSHHIREPRDWWQDLLEKYFETVYTTCDLGPFKANWQNDHPGGNLLIVAENS